MLCNFHILRNRYCASRFKSSTSA